MIGQDFLHYRDLKKIADGGMGAVYQAIDTRLNRKVALKFLMTQDSESQLRFTREALAVAKIDHPNICTVYEIGDFQGTPFISMAFIDGLTLEQKVARGALGLQETIDIATQVVNGLQEAHAKGIVHRDIKSANIMISRKGHVKVMDFGVAKVAEGEMITRAGSTIGTASFMSPEQVHGEVVDHRADIWAIGILIYLMLAGKLPFEGNWFTVMTRILDEEPEALTRLRSDVHPELTAIIDRCLKKDREQRYQSCGDLLGDLEDFRMRHLSGSGQYFTDGSIRANRPSGARKKPKSSPKPAEPPAATAKSDSPWRWLAPVLLLAILGGGWYYVSDRPVDDNAVQRASGPAVVVNQDSLKTLAEAARAATLKIQKQAEANDARLLASARYRVSMDLQSLGNSALRSAQYRDALNFFSRAERKFAEADSTARSRAAKFR